MLKKLIKYEWKTMAWQYAAPFLVYIAVCVLSFFLIRSGNPTAEIWGTVLVSVGAMVLAVVMFLAFFRRYDRNFYGGEGYLMFTLPVRTRSLLFAKLLVSFIWFTLYLALLFAVLLFFLIPANHEMISMPALSDLLTGLWNNMDKVLLTLLYYVVAVLGGILDIYFAITVSHLELWRRFGKLMGFVAFVAVNFVFYLPFWFMSEVLHLQADMGQGLFNLSVKEGSGTLALVSVPATLPFWLTLAYTAAFHVGIFFLIAWVMERRTTVK